MIEIQISASSRRMGMFKFERNAWDLGFARVAGVDEAGRGPLAGPIVAAAVILRKAVKGVNDSKQLTEIQREAFYEQLTEGGHAIGVAAISSEEIDRIGIQQANYRAMVLAVAALTPTPDYVLVDGFQVPGLVHPQLRLVKGDARSFSIAAASIIAKVTRDRQLLEFEALYPGYGFARHKGYGTAEHLAALETLGPCPIHRRSFAPLARHPETGVLL